MLRRFQPISRAGQWSEVIRWIDQRTRKPQSLADATLTMALYQHENGSSWCHDYGRTLPGFARPILSAATQADGSGPFVILPDQKSAQFTFPAGSLANLWPGDALLVVWATVGAQTDEIQRDTIRVLDGPRGLPGQLFGGSLPSQDITVVVDGGRI